MTIPTCGHPDAIHWAEVIIRRPKIQRRKVRLCADCRAFYCWRIVR